MKGFKKSLKMEWTTGSPDLDYGNSDLPICGISSAFETKIIGGQPAKPVSNVVMMCEIGVKCYYSLTRRQLKTKT